MKDRDRRLPSKGLRFELHQPKPVMRRGVEEQVWARSMRPGTHIDTPVDLPFPVKEFNLTGDPNATTTIREAFEKGLKEE